MKYIIMTLTMLLAAMTFVLEVSKTHAITVDIQKISFEDHMGNVVYSEHFAAGADLSEFVLPDAPERPGYIFVGWSGELPEEMPHADLVYVAIYVEHTLSLSVNVS